MNCKNKTCGCAHREQPRQDMIDVSAIVSLGETGIEAVRSLLAVARTGLAGVANLRLPNNELLVLAQTIAALYEERNRLQTLLAAIKVGDNVDLETSPTDVKIGFGPNKKYTLIVPVKEAVVKQELATGLRAVAAVLDPNSRQLPLPLEY